MKELKIYSFVAFELMEIQNDRCMNCSTYTYIERLYKCWI